MRYEVVSSTNLGGTEVLGEVEADCEATAAQVANERYMATSRSEYIYVRPARRDNAAPKVVPSPESFVFEVKNSGYRYNAAYGGANEEMHVKISRELLLRTLTDVLEAGLGKDSDTFTISLYGKLSPSEGL